MFAAWTLLSAVAMPPGMAESPPLSPSRLKVYSLTYSDSMTVCAILNQLHAITIPQQSAIPTMPTSYFSTRYTLPSTFIAIDSRTMVVGGSGASIRLADDWVKILDVGNGNPVRQTNTAAYILMKYIPPEELVDLVKEFRLKVKLAPVGKTTALVATGESKSLRQLGVLVRYLDRERQLPADDWWGRCMLYR